MVVAVLGELDVVVFRPIVELFQIHEVVLLADLLPTSEAINKVVKHRANAHVTPELQNLVNPKEYTGNDNVGGVGSQDIEDAFPIEM
ncbi:unnamed protein product [Prunus armeniaca]